MVQRRGRDSNPRESYQPPTRLAGECLQPLGHLSGSVPDCRWLTSPFVISAGDETPTPTEAPTPSAEPPPPAPKPQADGPPPQRPPLDTPTPVPIPSRRETLERYEQAFGTLPAPFAFVDLDAVWANAADMLRRTGGKPIRIATKSVRCRPMLQPLLELDTGFQGLLTFTLPETLWLWEQGMRDLLCAYPTADHGSLVRLARLTAEHPDEAPVVMVDSHEHLEMIESAA